MKKLPARKSTGSDPCKLVALFLLLAIINIVFAASPDDFPYQLSSRTDVPLALTAAVAGGSGLALQAIQPRAAREDIVALDRQDIPLFDRSATGHYSSTADNWSDIALRVSAVAPGLLALPLLSKKEYPALLTLAVMYAEASSINLGFTSTVKALVRRPRPFNYSQDLSLEKKLAAGKEGFRSFYSGHSSGAFCSAIFGATVFSDLYPESKFKTLVWGVSLAMATTTGILRYYAGKHYPTDIVTGACLGGLTGYLVPALHRRLHSGALSVRPVIGAGNGFCLKYRF